MRILIVDDSRVARTVLRRLLADIGYTDVDEAADGTEALEVALDGAYDLVITDWNMPEMDGMQLVRALRRAPGGDMPILMVSSESYLSRIIEVVQAGATGYVRKPFSPATLRRKLVEVVKKHELAQRQETEATLRGRLEEVGFPELVQMLAAGGKNGRLEISGARRSGHVEIRSGEIRVAHTDGVDGHEAIYAIALMDKGTFAFHASNDPVEPNISQPTTHLLLESMKRRDEHTAGEYGAA